MSTRSKYYPLVVATTVLSLIGGASQAGAAEITDEQKAAPSMLDKAKPISLDVLESQRGGTLVLNDMKLDGVVADNLAAHLQTGQNLIASGSLSGNTGFPTVIQNSGNNVLIQNATILNVQLQ